MSATPVYSPTHSAVLYLLLLLLPLSVPLHAAWSLTFSLVSLLSSMFQPRVLELDIAPNYDLITSALLNTEFNTKTVLWMLWPTAMKCSISHVLITHLLLT